MQVLNLIIPCISNLGQDECTWVAAQQEKETKLLVLENILS
jgi:hypothetical protein